MFLSDASFVPCGLNEVLCPDNTNNNTNTTPTNTNTNTNTPNVAPNPGGSTLATGSRTIALENGKLVSPKATGGLTSLIRTAGAADYAVDTKSATNQNWPVRQTLGEFADASTSNSPNFLGTPTNLTSGVTNYTEYRNDDTDTVLQVWDFDYSSVSAFRVKGGESSHKAFAFSGKTGTSTIDQATPAAAMPTGGTANYAGIYGSNGTASNWTKPEADFAGQRVVDPNMIFMSSGTAALMADFGASTVTGTLTPETWTWTQDNQRNRYTVSSDTTQWGTNPATPTTTGVGHKTPGFFYDSIGIQANIAPNTSTFSGTATLNAPGTTSSANPVFGGFFGPTLNEATGVFSVKGTYVDPFGSGTVGNDDREGYITHSGVFGTNCTGGAGCTP